jgi:S1-C subfamily serine protease
MKESLLFQTMPKLFSVSVGTTASAPYPDRCKSFLPILCEGSYFPQSLIYSMPEPVVLQPQDFQELGQTFVRGFLVGGALSRWSNVTMAESIARIATGRRIESRLQAVPFGPQPVKAALPGPLGTTPWRTANLVDPLRDVVEDEAGHGTATRLANVVPDRYTVMAKTGTIDEGDEGRESETFAAVVGPRVRDEFEFGRTIALYLYMEQSKTPNEPMKKFTLAEPVLRTVATYMDGRRGLGAPPPMAEAPPAPAAPDATAPPVASAPAPPPGDASGIEGVLDRALEGVVGVYADRGSGTGFFAGDKCRIVTNNHVIENSGSLSVVTHDGHQYTARVVVASAAKDLAILAIPVSRCVALPLESERARRGQQVYAIGYPFGFRESVTGGIVSAPARSDGGRDVIQIDAAVNPGNSGGPLISDQGRVLGITTYKWRGAEGVNFAIAVSELPDFLQYLR